MFTHVKTYTYTWLNCIHFLTKVSFHLFPLILAVSMAVDEKSLSLCTCTRSIKHWQISSKMSEHCSVFFLFISFHCHLQDLCNLELNQVLNYGFVHFFIWYCNIYRSYLLLYAVYSQKKKIIYSTEGVCCEYFALEPEGV